MFREVCLTEFDQKKAPHKTVDYNLDDDDTLENTNYSPGYRVVNEFAGSHCFTVQFSKTQVKERVLTWRVKNNCLELQDISLQDEQIENNQFVLKFPAKIIPDVCIVEDKKHLEKPIYIFVVTSKRTIHRITIKQTNFINNSSKKQEKFSILQSLSNLDVLSFSIQSSPSIALQALKSLDKDTAIIGSSNGDLIIVRFKEDDISEDELTSSSFVTKIFGPFWKHTQNEKGIVGIETCTFDERNFIFAYCSDSKLRIWSLESKTIIGTTDLGEFMLDSEFNYKPIRLIKSGIFEAELVISISNINEEGERKTIFDRAAVTYEQTQNVEDSIRIGSYSKKIMNSKKRLDDFVVCGGKIWGLWSDNKSYSIFNGSFSDSDSPSWSKVHTILKDLKFPVQGNAVNENIEEYLLSKILDGSIFPYKIIQKALNENTSEILSPQELRDLIKKEIFDLGNDEYELRNETELYSNWEYFWKKCLKHYFSEYTPVGFGLLHSSGSVGCINLNGITLLRTCDDIETICFDEEEQMNVLFKYLNDFESVEDLNIIITTIKKLSESIDFGELVEFENSLQYYETTTVYHQILMAFKESTESSSFFGLSLNKIYGIKHLDKKLHILMDLLKFKELDDKKETKSISFNHINLHQNICRQIIQTRFEFAKNFFLFYKLLEGSERRFSKEQKSYHHKDVVDDLFTILEKYSKMKWISLQQLDSLSNNRTDVSIQLSTLNIDGNNSKTLLNLIFRDLQSKNYYQSQQLKRTSDDYSQIILFYSISTILSFFEFDDKHKNSLKIIDICSTLYQNEQFALLDEYSILNVKDIPILSHFLGLVSLNFGVAGDAMNYFIRSSNLLDQQHQNQQEINIKILDTLNISNKNKSSMNTLYCYFTGIRTLCEKHPDLSLKFTKLALLNAKNNEDTSILLSNIFSASMEFSQYLEAYNAICMNEDKNRKDSDLHRFISVLCEKKEFSLLHSFPYFHFNSDFESILYQKAKNSSISNIYYEVLSSHYVRRSQFNKSASTMYEFSKRIEREGMGLEMLYKQRNSLLSSLNSLKMADSSEQWFFAPKIQEIENSKRDSSNSFLFTDYEPKHKKRNITEKNQIITLTTLQKELLMIKCRIKLSKTSTVVISNNMNPSDILGLLVSSSFYDDAISIANLFKLDKRIIFETLTEKCCISKLSSSILQLNIERDFCEIFENDEETEESLSQGWKLIQYYLTKYDSVDTNFEYHSIVLRKILSIKSDFEVPQWLIKSIKYFDPTSLIRIYTDFSFLEKGMKVVNEYLIWKLEKEKSETFKSNASIPFTRIDFLTQEVNKIDKNEFEEIKIEYKENLKRYIESIQ
eukprot:gene5808-9631_t